MLFADNIAAVQYIGIGQTLSAPDRVDLFDDPKKHAAATCFSHAQAKALRKLTVQTYKPTPFWGLEGKFFRGSITRQTHAAAMLC